MKASQASTDSIEALQHTEGSDPEELQRDELHFRVPPHGIDGNLHYHNISIQKLLSSQLRSPLAEGMYPIHERYEFRQELRTGDELRITTTYEIRDDRLLVDQQIEKDAIPCVYASHLLAKPGPDHTDYGSYYIDDVLLSADNQRFVFLTKLGTSDIGLRDNHNLGFVVRSLDYTHGLEMDKDKERTVLGSKTRRSLKHGLNRPIIYLDHHITVDPTGKGSLVKGSYCFMDLENRCCAEVPDDIYQRMKALSITRSFR